MKTAEEIIKGLAEWSEKYPVGTIYSEEVRDKMLQELLTLETAAKEWVKNNL